MDSKRTGDCHATFLPRHPNDNNLCDDNARWWPLWHEYKNDKNVVPIYGACTLLGPNRIPDSNKYILWTDSVHSTYPSCYLQCLFNFDSHPDIITTNQHVALTHWEYLFTTCNTLGIFLRFYLL